MSEKTVETIDTINAEFFRLTAEYERCNKIPGDPRDFDASLEHIFAEPSKLGEITLNAIIQPTETSK